MAGRSVGNPLSAMGKKQASQIKESLAEFEFAAIYSSPLERCLQTVNPLALELGRRVRKAPEFLEMDYGTWSGQKLSDLRREKLWREIQRTPSKVRFPKGESFLGAGRRVFQGLNEINQLHGEKKVLVVTHGDIIKLALTRVLGLEIDKFQRIVIDPASLSIVDWRSKSVLAVNQRVVKATPERGVSSRRQLGGGSNV